jgi:hypothetical protein
MLAPLDILVLLKIVAKRGLPWVQQDLANELHISQASIHRALRVAKQAGLYNSERKQVRADGLEEALVHGARYFLAPTRAGETRGMPTAWAAPPLSDQLAVSDPMIPVWPDPYGEVRGISFEPLHPSVPKAARQDRLLYELLALVDALREGRARERQLAQKELHLRLSTT